MSATDLQLGIGQRRMGIFIPVMHKKGRIQFLPEGFHQPLIVRAEQRHIQVVIPGNEAIVANGAQQGAAGEEIGNISFFANAIQLLQQIQLSAFGELCLIHAFILLRISFSSKTSG